MFSKKRIPKQRYSKKNSKEDVGPAVKVFYNARQKSKTRLKMAGHSPLIAKLYDYELVPDQELSDKIKFFYSPYNIQYKHKKWEDFSEKKEKVSD